MKIKDMFCPGDLSEARDDIEYAGRTPRLFDQLAMCRVVSGASSDGFITSVEPAASAGATCFIRIRVT